MKIFFINWNSDYDTKMIQYLGQFYPVYDIQIPKKYLWLNKKFKKIKFVKNILGKLFIKYQLNQLKKDDIAIYNDSQIDKGINPSIIRNLNCYKILMLRNPMSLSFVKDNLPHFNILYDFEKKQYKHHKLMFLEQFLPIGFDEITKINSEPKRNQKITCFFLGRDKGRAQTLEILAKKLSNNGCKVDFYIVKGRNSNFNSSYYIKKDLTYDIYLQKTLSADILIDITQEGQSGWTLRVLESVYFNKKTITNNIALLETEIYSPDRFFILGYNDWNSFDRFLKTPYPPIPENVLYKYSPDNMINKILIDYKNNIGNN